MGTRACKRRARGAAQGVVRAAALVVALLSTGAVQAQNTIAIEGAEASAGQAEVVVPISATTMVQLTGLDVAIEFDPELCGRITNQQIRLAGRTLAAPQEGVRCPEAGRLALVLFNLSGDPVLPPGEGVIAEWVFSVRADAASGTFPLTLIVNQARNGPLRVTLAAVGAGAIAIEGGGTVTPTTSAETPTPTVETPTPTVEAPTPTPPAPTVTSAPSTETAAPATVTATFTPVATSTGTPMVVACTGDCDGDGSVSVANIIVGVNIALGNQSPSICTAFQNAAGEVTVAQLIRGVNNLLNGC